MRGGTAGEGSDSVVALPGDARGYAVQGLCMILPSLMGDKTLWHSTPRSSLVPSHPSPPASPRVAPPPASRLQPAAAGAALPAAARMARCRGVGRIMPCDAKSLVLEPMTHDANAKRAGLSRCQIRVPLEKLVTCSLLPSIEPPSPAASPFLAAAPAPLSPALLPQNLMAQHVEPAAGLVPLGEGSCEAPPDAAVAPPADSPSTDTATTSPPADTLAAAGAAGEGDVGGEGGEVVASSPLLLAPGGGAALPGDAPDAGKAAAGVEGEAGTGDVTAKGEEWKGDGKRAKAASELDRVRAEVRKAEARRSAQAGQAGVEGWGGHAQQAHGVSIPAHARPRREGSVSGDGSGEGSAPLVRRGEGRRLLVEWDCGDAIGRRSVVIAETGGLRHVEWVAQTLQDNKAALDRIHAAHESLDSLLQEIQDDPPPELSVPSLILTEQSLLAIRNSLPIRFSRVSCEMVG
ncbi:hypothetical protein T484DRAFT_1851943 [Baffinella frigidus]|nr:hypothetical protein T484DRAFT_1851943 [Cryptophyta sp. CCMP2293]